METAQQIGTLVNFVAAQSLKFNIVSSNIPAITSMFCPKFFKIYLAFSGVFSKLIISNFNSGKIL